jgi:hypothetical protein
MDSNPKFVICIVKKFHPPCLEVCVGYSFPLELTTYNVSIKSNILVKYNKAKINKQNLVVKIWHEVHTLQQITIYLTKNFGQKRPKMTFVNLTN